MIPKPTHLVRGEDLVQLSRMIYISSVTDTLFHAEHKKTYNTVKTIINNSPKWV